MKTVGTLLNAQREHSTYVYAIAAIAALNGLLFGVGIGVISGALLYINETFTLTPFPEGVITSSMLIRAMIGAAIGGQLSDRFGRRRMSFGGAVVFFVGSFGMALSPTLKWLVLWRVVEGVAVGVASIVGPLLIAETAPPDVLGRWDSSNS